MRDLIWFASSPCLPPHPPVPRRNLSNPDAAAWFRNIIKTNVLDANIA